MPASLPQASRIQTHSFTLGGQTAWFHDEGFAYGPVHTYDAWRPNGASSSTPAHKIHVLVPRDYSESTERYPVVYMNDGQTALFPAGPSNQSWQVAEALGELRDRDQFLPVILVAIHPAARDREYTHASWFPNHEYGGLDEYALFLAERVRPWFDEHYRTNADGKRTAIIGSSHGGLAAFYTGCRHPQSFHLVGALSPSFWVGRPAAGLGSSRLIEMAKSVLDDRALRPRIWIDWGMRGDGGRAGASEMAALLQSRFGYRKGEDLFEMEDADGGHDEAAWGHRFPSVLKALYGS